MIPLQGQHYIGDCSTYPDCLRFECWTAKVMTIAWEVGKVTQACSSYHQIVIWIYFGFYLSNSTKLSTNCEPRWWLLLGGQERKGWSTFVAAALAFHFWISFWGNCIGLHNMHCKWRWRLLNQTWVIQLCFERWNPEPENICFGFGFGFPGPPL